MYQIPKEYIFKYCAVFKSNYKNQWKVDGMVSADAWAPCNFKRDHCYQMSCKPILKFWQPLKLGIAIGYDWDGLNVYKTW